MCDGEDEEMWADQSVGMEAIVKFDGDGCGMEVGGGGWVMHGQIIIIYYILIAKNSLCHQDSSALAIHIYLLSTSLLGIFIWKFTWIRPLSKSLNFFWFNNLLQLTKRGSLLVCIPNNLSYHSKRQNNISNKVSKGVFV